MAHRPSASPPPAGGFEDDSMVIAMGLRIGALAAQLNVVDEQSTRCTDTLVENYAQRAMCDVWDRLMAARCSIAGHRSSSLQAATIQAAAAIALADNMANFSANEDAPRFRELQRLLWSVCDVLMAHAAEGDRAWANRHGIEFMAGAHANPWRDLEERIGLARKA